MALDPPPYISPTYRLGVSRAERTPRLNRAITKGADNAKTIYWQQSNYYIYPTYSLSDGPLVYILEDNTYMYFQLVPFPSLPAYIVSL